MAKPLIVILMGSKTDLGHCQKIADACMSYGIEVTMRIGSAHKTPEHILKFLKKYEADPRPKVYITVAGRSNALSGFTDGAVSAPVIACPPSLDSIRWSRYLFLFADALGGCPGGGARTGQCSSPGSQDPRACGCGCACGRD